jgi:homoserine O-acetyltransferase
MSFAASTAVRPEPFVPVSVPVEDRVHAERGEFAAVLSMRHAGPSPVRLRYEWVGPANAPVVVLAGGISAHRHVASNAQFSEKGWAEDLVGSGRALDPQQLRVLAFDFIGADGALDVPIDTADQADALALLLDHLGIRTLKAFVGYSYGALVGQQFAIRHRARVRQLVLASGAHRPHPYAAAWRALQRRAVALGQLQCGEDHGLALARQFAMLSYRTRKSSASASTPRRK